VGCDSNFKHPEQSIIVIFYPLLILFVTKLLYKIAM